ncbi:MAG: YigZ family protein [Bacteroidetes bacterium]|nr:YigZ family protein [Bacteroidota bacterium]
MSQKSKNTPEQPDAPQAQTTRRSAAQQDGGGERNDSYRTIAAAAETEIKILGSRFLSYAKPVPSGDAFLSFLGELRTMHHSATHHCFAWRMGMDREDFRYSDDGEPSGTAGKRILGSIDREGLTDVGIVVVRYFGGTKLGVGGLARAYSDAADAVLAACRIEERFITDDLAIVFPYDMTSQVHHVIELHDVEVLEREYLDDTRYTVRIRLSKKERFLEDMDAFTNRQVHLPPTD